MAKRTQKQWIYSPKKPKAPTIPARLKAEVTEQANELVESFFKPTFIEPPPADQHFNYVSDIYTKWWRSYFYFCAQYTSPSPNAISPYFEHKFARLTYEGGEHFTLSFIRHTGQWIERDHGQTLAAALATIRADQWFHP